MVLETTVLQSIWFFLWGLLWAVFFITDGFDLGVGTLLPFLGKSETDRRLMINAIGPLWDGNEVWLITAGGVTFAAFPAVYAVMFSSLYTPLLFILFALIFRGVSFEFRGKIESAGWKKFWDTCIFIGSAAPAVLFGVAFANIFKGLPFDDTGYHGNLISLLNPYGILGGVLFTLLFLEHGALWLAARTVGQLQNRAASTAAKIWPVLLCVIVAFLVASWFSTHLYANYLKTPVLFIVLALAVVALIGVRVFISQKQYFKAWFASAATIISATFFCIIGLYPNLFPSSMAPGFSLTAYNSSSSQLTLTIMLVVVAIIIPMVIAYQVWAYYLFKDKLTPKDLAYEESY
ncbi:MAG: cytochrome d ubiquinol oxidase subunit II [Desulfobacterales bacterium]|jgi:cytochrome d ubiquinol oxidase subunit II|nr:cytochrome d ubiquinol oxidase subunit II [Desulfobacterales bacterium]